ncbi:MAG: SDR family NAD(P)-dependent oxidoreductase [Idiomarina sp.]|nr:SDR family NAD(P)-dependent oxidoreductase [Idiomarina sp.]
MSTKQPIAVITGAGRRLGAHMTRVLLKQGWRVIALTRQETEELSALQTESLTVLNYNALSDDSVDEVAKILLGDLTHLDLLLHNASIYEKDALHEEDMNEYYDAVFRIHMKAPARLNTLLSPLLENSVRPTGNIIHITDIYVSNPNPEYALYCSTKAGLESLMVSYAKKLAPHVRVNAIQPGPVKFLPEHSAADQVKVLSETLLAVEGGFEALEQAIHSLLTNEYMTAASIRVDGGRAVAR